VQGQRPSESRSKVRKEIICEMQLKCGISPVLATMLKGNYLILLCLMC